MRVSHLTRFDSGIFLMSFAVLLVELLLTRIFSVTLYYHLSFMVVSLAMLGFGASGLLINLFQKRFAGGKVEAVLCFAAMLFAVSTVIAVGVAFRLPISLTLTKVNLLRFGLIYLFCVVPFLAGGLVVALILKHRLEQANRLYFFDLLGAALACMLFIPLTNWLGAPTAVLVGAGVAALAAAVFSWRNMPRVSSAAMLLGGMLFLTAIANQFWNFYDIRVTKGRQQPPMLALKWNSFSRVEVEASKATRDFRDPHRPEARGLSRKLDPAFQIAEVYLRYDANAATQVTRFDGDLSRLRHLRYDVTAAPYSMRRYRKVLVLGAGGGRDILTALQMGSGPVTAVEINPLTIELMRGQFKDFTGGLYDNYPGVRIVHDEGRSFLRHESEPYELIQASLVDTWAASSAGAYALTESNLYTVEAFADYLRHLSPDGVIAFSRWFFTPPAETLRVVTLAVEALKLQNVSEPSQHIFIVRTHGLGDGGGVLCTVLIKRSPFTEDELARLKAWATEMDFVITYAPDDLKRGVAPNEFHELLSSRYAQFVADYPYDISAVYDDRPFFFDRVPVAAWLAQRLGLATSRTGSGTLTLGGQALLASLMLSALCTIALMLWPLVRFKRWRKQRQGSQYHTPVIRQRSRSALWTLYFSCLGFGFITIELVLLQRFNLFLGYPVYSLSVVLFTMLLASGVGSLIAGRWNASSTLMRVFPLLCAVLFLYAVALPPLINLRLGMETVPKILLAVVLITPLSLLMGIPFPTALRAIGRNGDEFVAWAWAANGVASVFGSSVSMIISMTYGFTYSFWMGAAAYLLALLVAICLSRLDAFATGTVH
jgi:MFS family permease